LRFEWSSLEKCAAPLRGKNKNKNEKKYGKNEKNEKRKK